MPGIKPATAGSRAAVMRTSRLKLSLAITSVDEARAGKHRCCLHPHQQRPLRVGPEALRVGTSEDEGSADMASDLCY